MFVESKMQAMEKMKSNFPAVAGVHHVFTNKELEKSYVNLFKKVFKAATSSLL